MIGRQGRFRRRCAVLAGVAALTLALAIASVAAAAQHGVTIAGFAYAPDPITVKVGDSIRWTNNDGTSHTATADDGTWGTSLIGGGSSDSVTFDTAGTFAYHCAIHSMMHGTVVVQAAATPRPTATSRPRATSRPPAATPPSTDTPPTDSDSDETPSVVVVLVLIAAATATLELGRRRSRIRNRRD